MADLYYAKVFLDRQTGEYFTPASDGPPYTRWRQVSLDLRRCSLNDTFLVFSEGELRHDMDNRLFAGTFGGTHTIIRKGASPGLSEIERFRTSFSGTGCLLFLAALPVALLIAGFGGWKLFFT